MVPNGWNISSIDSISDSVKVGFVGSCQKDYRDSGIPLIRTTNLKNGKLDLKNIIYVTNEFHIKNKKSQLKEYDLLIARHGNHGSACMVPKGFQDANCLNIVIVRPDLTKVAPEFMLDLFNYSLSKKLSSKAAGSTQTVVNTKEIASQVATVPPLSEQRKIAEILSTWDKAIRTTERLIDNSKQQKKALMQQLLTGKKRLLDDSGKPFEWEWQRKLFKEILRLDRGSSPRPIVNFITEDSDGVNWIKIGDTKNDTSYITATKEKISLEGAKKSRKVSAGEIIVSNSMSYGKPYILKIDGYIHDGWFVLRDYQEHIDTTFLIQLLSSEFVQAQYKRLAAGGVVTNISSELVYAVKVNLPQISEQRKIAAVLSNADKEIVLFEKQLADLKQEKKALMQQLLTGKRRVKPEIKEDL